MSGEPKQLSFHALFCVWETIPISFYDFACLIIVFLFIFFIIYAIISAKYGER
ncbi:MAG: hypothetical protein IBV52_02470 [Candidatus Bathyarchaeota archaeon]